MRPPLENKLIRNSVMVHMRQMNLMPYCGENGVKEIKFHEYLRFVTEEGIESYCGIFAKWR